MQYDPIKRRMGGFFKKSPFLRKAFYFLLDLLLLRTWHVHKELRKWKRNKGNNVNILDAGCGFGQYTWYLSRMNASWKVKGLDVKEEEIKECSEFFHQQKRNNVSFEVADLTCLNDIENYDLVISVDVMEHIEEDVKVFANFYNALKNGGMLLVSTPSDQGGSDVHEMDDKSFIEEHVRDGYNMRDLEEKLKRVGFSHVNIKYQYGTSGKISWKLSMKYPVLMLGWSKWMIILLPFYYLIVYPFCFILNCLDVWTSHTRGTGLIAKAWK